MRKRLTPKEKLIARLKAEGIIPESHTIHIEVMRWSTYRREMQWLPRVVILHYRPGVRLPEEIHADQTVTELANARRLTLWGVGTQETPELLGENSLTLEEEYEAAQRKSNPSPDAPRSQRVGADRSHPSAKPDRQRRSNKPVIA